MESLEAVDIYGTLIKFHELIERTLQDIIKTAELDISIPDLRAAWRSTQGPLQQAADWRPYKQIVADG